MKLKAVSGIMLTLLLIGMLTLAFNVQSVKASGTIYIMANGSVNPPTANITSFDNITYTFTGNISDEIVVERDNIVIDGASYTLQGTGVEGSEGISLSGRSNVTIKNIKIKAFYVGIYLAESSNNNISRNNIASNRFGIVIWYSSNYNIISRNKIINNYFGIELEATGNTIFGNNITNNYYGTEVSGTGNTISGNNITNNKYDGIGLAYASNNTISGNKITNNGVGIELEFCSNSSVYGNNITNNGFGIRRPLPIMANHGVYLEQSSNNIYHNNFIDNTRHVLIEFLFYAIIWDDEYPSGGNYWSNHNPPDIYSGPYQNETGRDGIGDTAYVTSANATDRYPLIYPYGYVPSPDLNDDGTVDIYDAITLANSYGAVPGHPRWNHLADINQGGIIDIYDAITLASKFGSIVYRTLSKYP